MAHSLRWAEVSSQRYEVRSAEMTTDSSVNVEVARGTIRLPVALDIAIERIVASTARAIGQTVLGNCPSPVMVAQVHTPSGCLDRRSFNLAVFRSGSLALAFAFRLGHA